MIETKTENGERKRARNVEKKHAKNIEKSRDEKQAKSGGIPIKTCKKVEKTSEKF